MLLRLHFPALGSQAWACCSVAPPVLSPQVARQFSLATTFVGVTALQRHQALERGGEGEQREGHTSRRLLVRGLLTPERSQFLVSVLTKLRPRRSSQMLRHPYSPEETNSRRGGTFRSTPKSLSIAVQRQSGRYPTRPSGFPTVFLARVPSSLLSTIPPFLSVTPLPARLFLLLQGPPSTQAQASPAAGCLPPARVRLPYL